MSLPPLKYPVARPFLGEAEKAYVKEALDTNWISSAGPFIKRFEELFATKFGPGHCVAVNSGTMAIDLALKSVGVMPGDEVIVPNFTFVGSVSPIYRLQAIPVLAPTAPNSYNVDVEALSKLITPKTKAIIAVHLYGVPCDIEPIVKVAHEHGLKVIEDCAESLGAKVNDQFIGTFGDVGCYSFFGNKVLTSGEGGMCIAKTSELADAIRLYRDHGMDQQHRYWHTVIGYNGRMTNLQAAVGLGQCERIEEIIQQRQSIQDQFSKFFDATPFFRTMERADNTQSVCWLMSPVLKKDMGLNRDELLQNLRMEGVETRPFFYPCSTMPAYSRFGFDDEHSMDISSHGFNLPTYPSLEPHEIKEIAEATVSLLEQQASKNNTSTIYAKLPEVGLKSAPHVSIVLPTYNEEKHIVSIITILRQKMISISTEYEIIVVDDQSQDQTISLIKTNFQHDKNISIIQRVGQKNGLAASIKDGIHAAQGEVVLVMDSNFNHDPKHIASIVKASEFYDMVSGSRFTTGGGIENKRDQFYSWVCNNFIRLLLHLPTRDNLSGFFCMKRSVLLSYDLDYIFQNHGDYFFRLIYFHHVSKRSILEIPVIFKKKDHFVSKTPLSKIFLLYLKEILRLSFKK